MKITMSVEELQKIIKSPIDGYVVTNVDVNTFRSDASEQAQLTLQRPSEIAVAAIPPPAIEPPPRLERPESDDIPL